MKKIIIMLSIVIFMFVHDNAFTYDSYNVHPEINEKASRQSEKLFAALINIGFENGVDHVLGKNWGQVLFLAI